MRPVGGDAEVPFDARIIAATNRDLESAVEEERFREDLYYRINVIHIALPPLRARGGDVLLLAQHFLDALRGAAPTSRSRASRRRAAEQLLAYAWPGNVRELQNCIERAVALTRFEQHHGRRPPREDPRLPAARTSLVASDDPSELVPLEEVERRYILRVMEAVGGNKTLAAQVLGFDRKTLYRKLEAYARAGRDEGAER